MSYYYNYMIGYELDGKIYPFGPYTHDHKLRDVISRSRSFASDLHERFYAMQDEQVSDELRAEFEYDDWNGEKRVDVKYLPLSELPHGDFVKSGYYLISDVQQYENGDDSWDLFYDHVSPEVYATLVQQQLTFGKPQPVADDEGEMYTPRCASDYMFFAYPDFYSEEYEAFLIRKVADMLDDYHLPKGAQVVALETEG